MIHVFKGILKYSRARTTGPEPSFQNLRKRQKHLGHLNIQPPGPALGRGSENSNAVSRASVQLWELLGHAFPKGLSSSRTAASRVVVINILRPKIR